MTTPVLRTMALSGILEADPIIKEYRAGSAVILLLRSRNKEETNANLRKVIVFDENFVDNDALKLWKGDFVRFIGRTKFYQGQSETGPYKILRVHHFNFINLGF